MMLVQKLAKPNMLQRLLGVPQETGADEESREFRTRADGVEKDRRGPRRSPRAIPTPRYVCRVFCYLENVKEGRIRFARSEI